MTDKLIIPRTQRRPTVSHDGDIECRELVWVVGSTIALNINTRNINAQSITLRSGGRLLAQSVSCRDQTWVPGARDADGRAVWTLQSGAAAKEGE